MSPTVQFEQIRSNEEIKKKLHVSLLREILDYLWYFLRVFVIVSLCYIFIKTNVFRSFMVEGKSMYPNYDTGQVVYVNKIAPKIGDIRRGEVVVINRDKKDCPEGTPADGCFYIKRVIGLPGEKVKIQDGEVYIINKDYPNGVELNEQEYLSKNIHTYKSLAVDAISFTSPEIGKGSFFLMGDNRPYSSDSRVFGIINEKDIQGKEFFRKDTGFFKLPKYNISNFNE